MKEYTKEIWVGFFALFGFFSILYLAIFFGSFSFFTPNTYTIFAEFPNITGIKKGASVSIAGVQIGKVGTIGLNNDSSRAVITLIIPNSVSIPEDSVAMIKTSGLIGDKYVTILPGNSEITLGDNESIFETQAPIDIEELLGKFVFGNITS
ncbi:MAG: outer membrane lipid asymmetry maintenance protein MlaD [Desulfovibrionaceae bacterium]